MENRMGKWRNACIFIVLLLACLCGSWILVFFSAKSQLQAKLQEYRSRGVAVQELLFTQEMVYGPQGMDDKIAMRQEVLVGTPQAAGFLNGWHFLIKDSTGNVRGMTSAYGDLLEYYFYSLRNAPQVVRVTGATTAGEVGSLSRRGNQFYQHGRRYDLATNTYYYRHRYYDPETQRFVQRDPSGSYADPYAAGNPYVAFGNNPVNMNDEMGEEPITIGAYITTQAAISLAETGVEAGMAWYFEDDQFSFGASYGKNFAINLATGGIGGGTKLWAKAGLYAARQGIEIAGDTAFDVFARGQDWQTSLAYNTAGSLVGEGLARGVGYGFRKTLGRGSHGIAAQGMAFEGRATHYLESLGERTMHRKLPKMTGEYSGTARDLLAISIREMRLYRNIPPRSLLDLIKLTKKMYPRSFTK